MSDSYASRRPRAVSFLAIINAIGFIITLLFWLFVLFGKLVPYPGEVPILQERTNAATTYGFAIGDLVWSSLLLALSFAGLWRLRSWGWMAAQMTNALWIYSMTVVLIRDAFTQFTPGSIVFTPFALIALWSTYYLWKNRMLFWDSGR